MKNDPVLLIICFAIGLAVSALVLSFPIEKSARNYKDLCSYTLSQSDTLQTIKQFPKCLDSVTSQ